MVFHHKLSDIWPPSSKCTGVRVATSPGTCSSSRAGLSYLSSPNCFTAPTDTSPRSWSGFCSAHLCPMLAQPKGQPPQPAPHIQPACPHTSHLPGEQGRSFPTMGDMASQTSALSLVRLPKEQGHKVPHLQTDAGDQESHTKRLHTAKLLLFYSGKKVSAVLMLLSLMILGDWGA